MYNDEKILKFIEETSLKLILLADIDNISDVVVSRCSSILKLPQNEFIKKCVFDKKISVYNMGLDIEDSKERAKYLSENNAHLVADYNRVRKQLYKERLMEIIVGMEEI